MASAFSARVVPWLPAAVFAALIFFLSSRSSVPQPPGGAALPFIDKVEHFTEYALFAFLLMWGARWARPGGLPWSAQWDAHVVLVIAALYAVSDEVHQAFVPLRAADPLDALVDTLGAAFAAFVADYKLPHARREILAPAREAVVDDIRIAYTDEGAGPTLLYIHGWHASKRYFEGAAPRLPGLRHIALDLPGFGQSEAPVDFSYSPAAQAKVVRQFARGLEIGSAAVVGHSMGGAVALELALADPSFVRSLVLVEPALNIGIKAPFLVTLEDARAVRTGLVRQLRGLHVDPLRQLIVKDPHSLTPALMEDARASPVHASLRAITQLARTQWVGRLTALKTRVLLVFGDEGNAARANYARKVREMLPDAELLFIPATSHCPMVEAPDEFYKAVGQFAADDARGASS